MCTFLQSQIEQANSQCVAVHPAHLQTNYSCCLFRMSKWLTIIFTCIKTITVSCMYVAMPWCIHFWIMLPHLYCMAIIQLHVHFRLYHGWYILCIGSIATIYGSTLAPRQSVAREMTCRVIYTILYKLHMVLSLAIKCATIYKLLHNLSIHKLCSTIYKLCKFTNCA